MAGNGVGGREVYAEVGNYVHLRMYHYRATHLGLEELQIVGQIGQGALYVGRKDVGVGEIGGRRPNHTVVERIEVGEVVGSRVAVANADGLRFFVVQTEDIEAVGNKATILVKAAYINPTRVFVREGADAYAVAVGGVDGDEVGGSPRVAFNAAHLKFEFAIHAYANGIGRYGTRHDGFATIDMERVVVVTTSVGENGKDNGVEAHGLVVNRAVELPDFSGGPTAVASTPFVGKAVLQRRLTDTQSGGIARANIHAVGPDVHNNLGIDVYQYAAEVVAATLRVGSPSAVRGGNNGRHLHVFFVDGQSLAAEYHRTVDSELGAVAFNPYERRIPIAANDDGGAGFYNVLPCRLRIAPIDGIAKNNLFVNVGGVKLVGHHVFPLVFTARAGRELNGVAVANGRVGRDILMTGVKLGELYFVVELLFFHKQERVFELRGVEGILRVNAVVRRGYDNVELVLRFEIGEGRGFLYIEGAVHIRIFDEVAVQHPAVARVGALVGGVGRKLAVGYTIFYRDVRYPSLGAVEVGLHVQGQGVYLALRGVEQLIVAEVTYHTVGHFNHKAVNGGIVSEGAFVLTLFVNFHVGTV